MGYDFGSAVVTRKIIARMKVSSLKDSTDTSLVSLEANGLDHEPP